MPSDARAALVTGAAGFIGSHLCTSLIEQGVTVIGMDNSRSGDWTRVGAEVIRDQRDVGELTLSDWRQRLDGVDQVFHLAAEKYNSSKSSPEQVIRTNVSATTTLAEAAGQTGVSHIVFTSSLYAYGFRGPADMVETDVPAPDTYYGVSKLAGEHIMRTAARNYDLGWSVARLFFTYGPRQWAEGGYKSVILTNFERLQRGEAPVINGDGQQALDYVFVQDVVRGLQLLAAPEHNGLTCNLGSGIATSVNDLTQRMMTVSGVQREPVIAPADHTAGTRRVGNVKLAEQVLGWTADTSLDDGLAAVWAWMESTK